MYLWAELYRTTLGQRADQPLRLKAVPMTNPFDTPNFQAPARHSLAPGQSPSLRAQYHGKQRDQGSSKKKDGAKTKDLGPKDNKAHDDGRRKDGKSPPAALKKTRGNQGRGGLLSPSEQTVNNEAGDDGALVQGNEGDDESSGGLLSPTTTKRDLNSSDDEDDDEDWPLFDHRGSPRAFVEPLYRAGWRGWAIESREWEEYERARDNKERAVVVFSRGGAAADRAERLRQRNARRGE